MDLCNYLLDTFRFNDNANRQVLEKIKHLSGTEEIIKHFSHLINCQYKWLARIQQDPGAQAMDWWDPIYPFDELENKWANSLDKWILYIQSHSEAKLMTEVQFIGFDGTTFAATPADIALQLNYHSIHHRAQVQLMIRSLGLTPDFVDYIGTRYRRVNG
jgi:uncharacterized damage-inducible protein DinB